MKIVITTVQVPFVMGGAEFHAQSLKNALIKSGHQAEIVTMPLVENPTYMVENCIAASRMFDLEYSAAGKIDLCIGLKFPAYYIPHPNKIIWALHQYRAAYDLYYTDYSALRHSEPGKELRRVIYNADNTYLKEAKRIYANSQNVANRMQRYNGITSTPLYHPCPDMDKFYCCEYEDYILMPSRINPTKRQVLALEALALTKSNVKIYFVGKADNEFDQREFDNLIVERGLQDRVRCFGFVSHEETLDYIRGAKAVIYPSLWYEGFPMTIVESYSVGTPVIGSNLGNTGSLIEEGKSGWKFDADSKEQLCDALRKAMETTKGLERDFVEKYSAESNYEQLREIYETCCNHN